MKSKLTIFKEC